MNNHNINKPHMAIYLGLLLILFVLIGFVSIIPLPNLKKSAKISPTPSNPIGLLTPTEMTRKISPTAKPVLVAPTGTGGMEEIPKKIEDMATQKQKLKTKLPLQGVDFKIEFDYVNDKFIVTFTKKSSDSINKFQQWLKTQYPSLSIDKFDFK